MAQYIPLSVAIALEVDVISVSAPAHTFQPALSCLASGVLGKLHLLITQKVSFDNAEEGFRWMLAGKDKEERPVIKVIVEGEKS